MEKLKLACATMLEKRHRSKGRGRGGRDTISSMKKLKSEKAQYK